jgi:hypothetical protein
MTHCEITPNRIDFHNAEQMRDLQGVGVQLKEQKLVDHRPKNSVPLASSPHRKEPA